MCLNVGRVVLILTSGLRSFWEASSRHDSGEYSLEKEARGRCSVRVTVARCAVVLRHRLADHPRVSMAPMHVFRPSCVALASLRLLLRSFLLRGAPRPFQYFPGALAFIHPDGMDTSLLVTASPPPPYQSPAHIKPSVRQVHFPVPSSQLPWRVAQNGGLGDRQ
jgi:hypothetical protein